MIHPASHLRAMAQEKIEQDKEDMDAWIGNLAEAISDWCEENAESGDMSCDLSDDDLGSIMDSDIPDEKINLVIRGAKALLEQAYEYKVSVDDFDPKTKFQSDYINGITVDWSGK